MKGNRVALYGLILGIAGAVLLALFVAQAGRREAEPTVAALRVAEPLTAGLTAQQVAGLVEPAQIPVDLAPASLLIDLTEVDGQTIVRPVARGELLTTTQFADSGPLSGGFVVREGYEAISLEAAAAPGGEGYVTPGSRVNVYATLTQQQVVAQPADTVVATAQPATFTQLVLSHVDVLAVTRGTLTGEAQAPEAAAGAGQIVMLLEVRPEDAPVLIHAQQQGSLWFTIANAEDPSATPVRIDADDLSPEARAQAITEARQQQAAADAAEAAEQSTETEEAAAADREAGDG